MATWVAYLLLDSSGCFQPNVLRLGLLGIVG